MALTIHDYLSDPHTIFLVPDRALSTFGKRLLKSWQVRASKWPIPAVYSFSDLACALLKSSQLSKKIPADYEIFAELLARDPQKNPMELLESFDIAKKYLKTSCDIKLWAKILGQDKEAEEKQKLSVKTISAVSCVIQILSLSFDHETPLHSSQFFSALDGIDFHSLNWSKLLQRQPGSLSTAKETKFFVVGHKDLLPYESSLLEKLEKQFKIIRQNSAVDASAFPEWNTLQSKTLQPNAQILWLENNVPGPIEATSLLALPEVRSTVTQELRYFDPIKKQILQNKFNFKLYFDALKFEYFASSKTLLCEAMAKMDSRECVELFQRIDLANDEKIERNLPISEAPSTPVLLGLEDASLLNPALTQIWSNEDEWKNMRQTPFSEADELEKYFLAERLAIPDPEYEHKRLVSILCKIAAEGSKLIDVEARVSKFSEEGTSILAEKVPQRISPSGLEQFFRCPLQFHFAREERLPMQEVFDDLDGSPLRRGTWLHSVFEELSFQNASEITLKEIEQLLVKKSVKAFEGAGSKSYLELLQSQKRTIAENIFYYIQGIEVRLEKRFPHRKIQRELEIKIPWPPNLTLMGRVDRLDFTGEEFFLWDYKSGDFSRSTFSTAAKNGKFQWLLYAEIFEREGKPIVGGGYINPLQLSKSRLIFVDRARQLLDNDFFDQLNRLEIAHEIIKEAEFRDLKKFVVDTTNDLVKKMLTKDRPSTPASDRECDYCAYQGLCGHPYGISVNGAQEGADA